MNLAVKDKVDRGTAAEFRDVLRQVEQNKDVDRRMQALLDIVRATDDAAC